MLDETDVLVTEAVVAFESPFFSFVLDDDENGDMDDPDHSQYPLVCAV